MKKIIYFTPFYKPQHQAASTRAQWFVKQLATKAKVKIYSTTGSEGTETLLFNSTDNRHSNLKRIVFEFLAGIELFLRIFFQRADLVVLSSPPFITISIAHWAARLKCTPYIVDVRDLYPEVYISNKLLKADSWVTRLVRKHTDSLYGQAKEIISVTPGLVQKIKDKIPTPNKVHFIPNGFDHDHFRHSGIKNEKFTVMFHGTMGKIQNIAVILEVAKRLEKEGVEFHFIGRGEQSKLIRETKLKNVHYLGEKTYEEIPAIIGRAHVGFSARVDSDIGEDAFPVKVFEYLGVGIPVILTPGNGVMRSLVASEAIFEFQNSEIEKIAQQILHLRDHPVTFNPPLQFTRAETSKKILELCDFN